jgi:hypothetical protein
LTTGITIYTKIATLDKLSFAKMEDGTYQVGGLDANIEGEIVLPMQYDNQIVSTANFKSHTKITSVIIPTTIKDISAECFRSLGEYEDSVDQELVTYYEKAQQLRANGDYVAAIEALDGPASSINSTASKNLLEKYQAEVKEWKYDYILNHKNGEDKNTFDYVVDFRREQYRRDEMDAIYQELFEWQLKVVVNDNENDTTNNKFTFATSEDVYVHVTAIKGSPSYKGDIVCTFYNSNSEKVESGSVELYIGESGVIEFSGGIYFVSGKYTMEITCDSDVLYTKTIELT